jgi:SAM-dependent methyltransferase
MVTKAKANVTVIDPSQTVMVQKMYAQKVGILGGMIPESFDLFDNPKHGIAADTYATPDERLTIRVADATRMDFADAAFDAVACVSTIEHISDDGDIPAIREIARVLKPGGRAFISVPYAQEYKEGRTHGGAFERMYDPAALRTRLVEPSGLAVAAEGFLVDRKSRKITDATYYNLPGRWRYMLGWYCVFLAFWLSSRDRASATDAQFAYLLLSKK